MHNHRRVPNKALTESLLRLELACAMISQVMQHLRAVVFHSGSACVLAPCQTRLCIHTPRKSAFLITVSSHLAIEYYWLCFAWQRQVKKRYGHGRCTEKMAVATEAVMKGDVDQPQCGWPECLPWENLTRQRKCTLHNSGTVAWCQTINRLFS